MPDMMAAWGYAGSMYQKQFPNDTSSGAYKIAVLQSMPIDVEEIDASKIVCDFYTGMREDDTSSNLYNTACGGSPDFGSLACEIYKDSNPDDTTSLSY